MRWEELSLYKMATSTKISDSSITRNSLREAVYKKLPQLSRNEATRLIDEVFEEIILALLQDEKVKLIGFGHFKVQHKKERSGRNPKSGVDAVISARRSVKFVASGFLKARVNDDDMNNHEEDAE